ncbi:MAG: FAD-binding protein, partial [Deltaproteobacteria bacterium]|nr:FAD-binding protein [Deltaproteobacteria bacterium]
MDGYTLQALYQILGPKHLLTRPDETEKFASDATDLKFVPEAVAFPGNAEEVSRILLLANEVGFPVIPRGAGSGKTGGALPVEGGLVLAMDRFNRILRIDRDNLIAEVEPGVVTARFQEEVEKVGLFYPPDPASFRVSTIGGNVATCAGGLRAVKYGVTRDYVIGLSMVLPTGEMLRTGVETPKGVVGYDLTRLVVGSEGTLAVITSITLRLLPKPEMKKSMLAFFDRASTAVRTVSEMIRSGILPATLEFMDRLCLDCMRNQTRHFIPPGAEALLLIEVDGDRSSVEMEAERIRRACQGGGCLDFRAATRGEEAEEFWEIRREISETLFVYGPHKISEDVVVPRSRIAEFIDILRGLETRYRLSMPTFGHAGDGNLHVNIMYDKDKEGESERAELAVKDLFRHTLKMGGTISGEHGIGLTKAPY